VVPAYSRCAAVLDQQAFLPAWLDYFLHGGTISQFGDPRAADGSSIWLSGFPPHFYHYASYMIPASLAVPLDQPGLPLATSVWLPIGFLSLAAAAYALGYSLAGSAGGSGGTRSAVPVSLTPRPTGCETAFSAFTGIC
jgi:hypothetical protein